MRSCRRVMWKWNSQARNVEFFELDAVGEPDDKVIVLHNLCDFAKLPCVMIQHLGYISNDPSASCLNKSWLVWPETIVPLRRNRISLPESFRCAVLQPHDSTPEKWEVVRRSRYAVAALERRGGVKGWYQCNLILFSISGCNNNKNRIIVVDHMQISD